MSKLGRDNFHSKAVAFLKVALPLTALLLLSTLFLFSQGIKPEDAIPYASVDVGARLRDPRMTTAGYAGMTEDGSAITLSASEAMPGVGGNASAKGVVGVLETPDGVKTELTAPMAAMDQSAGLLRLSEGVKVTSSTGFEVRTQGLDLNIKETRATSQGAVTVTGPFGEFSADSFNIEESATTKGQYLLVFKGRVRLLYQPQT